MRRSAGNFRSSATRVDTNALASECDGDGGGFVRHSRKYRCARSSARGGRCDLRGTGSSSAATTGTPSPAPLETLERLRALPNTMWIRVNGERWLRERPEIRRSERRTRGSRGRSGRGGRVAVNLPTRAPARWDPLRTRLADLGRRKLSSEPGEEDERLLGDVRDRTVVFGHSHWQFRRPRLRNMDLVYPGSVGMPLDGDVRSPGLPGTETSPSGAPSTTSNARPLPIGRSAAPSARWRRADRARPRLGERGVEGDLDDPVQRLRDRAVLLCVSAALRKPSSSRPSISPRIEICIVAVRQPSGVL